MWRGWVVLLIGLCRAVDITLLGPLNVFSSSDAARAVTTPTQVASSFTWSTCFLQSAQNLGYVFSNTRTQTTTTRCFGVVIETFGKRIQISYLGTSQQQIFRDQASIDEFTSGNWHGVAVRATPSKVAIFFDGVKVGEVTLTAAINICAAGNTFIGSHAGSLPFDGYLKNMTITTSTLSDDDVLALTNRCVLNYPSCRIAQQRLGDGFCDFSANVQECGFDAGDCCPATCQSSSTFTCTTTLENCVDPRFSPTPSSTRTNSASSSASPALVTPSPTPSPISLAGNTCTTRYNDTRCGVVSSRSCTALPQNSTCQTTDPVLFTSLCPSFAGFNRCCVAGSISYSWQCFDKTIQSTDSGSNDTNFWKSANLIWVIGVIVLVPLLFVFVFCCVRSRREKSKTTIAKPTTINPIPAVQSSFTTHAPKIFGASLDVGAKKTDPQGLVPIPVTKPINFINSSCLKKEGLYTAVGDPSRVAELVRQFDLGQSIEFPPEEPFANVTTILVKYINALPETIFTSTGFTRLGELTTDSSQLLGRIKAILFSLPNPYYSTSKVVFQHLSMVLENRNFNRTSSKRLAAIFFPKIQVVAAFMIEHFTELFGVVRDETPDLANPNDVDSLPSSAFRTSVLAENQRNITQAQNRSRELEKKAQKAKKKRADPQGQDSRWKRMVSPISFTKRDHRGDKNTSRDRRRDEGNDRRRDKDDRNRDNDDKPRDASGTRERKQRSRSADRNGEREERGKSSGREKSARRSKSKEDNARRLDPAFQLSQMKKSAEKAGPSSKDKERSRSQEDKGRSRIDQKKPREGELRDDRRREDRKQDDPTRRPKDDKPEERKKQPPVEDFSFRHERVRERPRDDDVRDERARKKDQAIPHRVDVAQPRVERDDSRDRGRGDYPEARNHRYQRPKQSKYNDSEISFV
eukprot:c1953_g1_i1.p1 GENE.c1953_g1_i1~~c1953_g1_i1.p1  ORF type:complete len:936 (+),score=129.19 c1953_g1_i1:60-2810(+)